MEKEIKAELVEQIAKSFDINVEDVLSIEIKYKESSSNKGIKSEGPSTIAKFKGCRCPGTNNYSPACRGKH